MSCKPICHYCRRMIFSQSVTFTGGNLIIDIPAGNYNNCEKYCISIIQTIPATTTIYAPVFITIGGGAVLYPLTKPNCVQVIACSIRTRTRYSTCVYTSVDGGGTFRLLGYPACAPNNAPASINGDGIPVTATAQITETPVNLSADTVAASSANAPSKTTKTVTTTTKEILQNE